MVFSYTTNQLIANAYYAAGVVSREFATVSGGQISDGLGWLNDILTDKRVEKNMVAYETTYKFNSIVGQEIYFIPNLIEMDTLVFYLDQVRYCMSYDKRNAYFSSPRVENIQTLPYEWYLERQNGGANLYIYFKPDRNYPMELHGIFNVAPVELGQDLSSNVTIADLGIPTFYGLGSLSPGQLVISTPSIGVNGASTSVDLMGNYSNIGALINYINTGIIPGVAASINVNDFVLSSLTEPPASISIQSSGYIGGTSFIGNVAVATISDLGGIYNNGAGGIGATLTAPAPAVLTIDGYTLLNPNPITGVPDRVLVKNEINPAQNGSYIISSVNDGSVAWVLTRTTNYDESLQINAGNLFTALNGTVNAGLTFIQSAQVNVIGTSAITFTVFNALTFSNFSTIENPSYKVFNAVGFDRFYITYLRYALAHRICVEYNYSTPVNIAKQLAEYEAWIKSKSRIIDLRMQKVSTLQKRLGLNWAQINIGRGFVPS